MRTGMGLIIMGLFAGFLLVSISSTSHAWITEISTTESAKPSTLDWLEPLGINIVDLVGQVPEEYLRGLIISYTPGYGIVQYLGGQRIGNTVVITTTVFPRFVRDGQWNGSMFGCLGQPAKNDQLGSISPASTIRILNGSEDVTRQATLYYYVPSGSRKPIHNPAFSQNQNVYRYGKTPMQTSSFTQDGKLFSLPDTGGYPKISAELRYGR